MPRYNDTLSRTDRTEPLVLCGTKGAGCRAQLLADSGLYGFDFVKVLLSIGRKLTISHVVTDTRSQRVLVASLRIACSLRQRAVVFEELECFLECCSGGALTLTLYCLLQTVPILLRRLFDAFHYLFLRQRRAWNRGARLSSGIEIVEATCEADSLRRPRVSTRTRRAHSLGARRLLCRCLYLSNRRGGLLPLPPVLAYHPRLSLYFSGRHTLVPQVVTTKAQAARQLPPFCLRCNSPQGRCSRPLTTHLLQRPALHLVVLVHNVHYIFGRRLDILGVLQLDLI